MAKSFTIAALVASALCFSSLLISACGANLFYVEGKVYCDTCRVEFETKLSEPISGALVKLECRGRANGSLTYTVEGKTDSTGIYSLAVEGDHEEEICEVHVVSSPRIDCNELFKTANIARVLLTNNVGVVEPKRYANALGFMKKGAALPGCAQLLKDMGFLPLELEQ